MTDAQTTGFSDKFNQGKSFRAIVGDYIWKLGQLRAVEFRGGYWQSNTSIIGGVALTIKTWIPDTREIYANGVKFLYIVVQPEMKRYESEHLKNCVGILKSIEDAQIEFIKTTMAQEKVILHLEEYSGDEKRKANQLRHSEINYYDALFSQITDFWCEMDYFSDDGGITDLGGA